jgi:hypothetical protein
VQCFHTFIFQENHKYTTHLNVELRWEGISGYGEATSNPTTISTIDNIVADLEKVRVVIEEIGDQT